jgi:hypothetical protein
VNRSTAEIPGEAYVNLHTVDSAQVQQVASTLDFGNEDLVLPPGQRTTVTRSFAISSTMRIIMLTAHMHERGEKFVIRVSGGPRNGEIVYTTTDWAHPELLNLATPLVLGPGMALVSEITYNNTTDRTIRFGLTSQDEMGIIFGYWYCDRCQTKAGTGPVRGCVTRCLPPSAVALPGTPAASPNAPRDR